MILIPADPISGAILALAGTVSASVAVGATAQTFIFFAVEALAYAGLSVGLSWITNAIAGKPKQSVAGIHTEITIGDTAPRRFGVGRYATGGSPLYANTFTIDPNKPNEFLVLVFDLSDTPVDGLEKIYVGDSAGTYSTGGHTYPGISGYSVPEFESGAEWYLWAQFYDGTQTAGDAALISRFGSDPNYPWTSAMIGAGVAYVIMTVRYNPQVFPGIPQFRFQLRGKRLYDPRADSSVGGSGSQRWDDPATYAWSENPAVAIYNLLRGVSAGGRWLYGLQTLNPALLPIDNWFAAASACDFPITDINGVTEPSYRCGFEINTSQPLVGALEELRKCCNGRLIESGGSYKLFIGAVPAYVMAFDDGHLLIDQNQSFDEFPSLNDTVNAITAKYPEPTQAWNIKDAPPLYNAAFEAADGDRRLPADIAYNAVPFASQVQRLMAASLEEARKFRKHALIMPPQFWPLEPGDVVRWNSAKNGYGNKDFRVDTVTRDPNLNILIGILECDPADYDFNPDTDYTAFDTLPLLGPPSTTPHPPLGLIVRASFRALVLDWINVPNFDLEATEIWRSATSSFGGAVKVAEVAPYVSHWVDEGLESPSQHWYWIRYRNKSGAFSAFHPSSAGAGATNITDTIDAGDLDLTAEDIRDMMLAEGLEFVQNVPNLSAADPAFSHVAFNQADGKLYRWNGSAWVASVPAVDITGTITSPQIADASITTTKLADGSVTTIKIGDSQVVAEKLADGSVVTSKIGDNQVISSKIGDSQITTAKIADSSVITTKLQDGSVTTIKVGDLQITENKLADGSISSIKIGDEAITSVKIADDAIIAPKIAANAVVAGKIAAGSIVAADMAAHTITAAQIAGGTITSNEIAANGILAVNIAASAITSDKIEANAVTAGKISAGAVGADQILAGSVIAGKLAAGAVDAGNIIVNDIVVTGHLVANAATIHSDCEYAGPSPPSSAPASFTTLASISINSAGFPITFSGAIGFLNNDNTTHSGYWQVTRNGSQVWPPSGAEILPIPAHFINIIPIVFAETPGAGTWTYAVNWRSDHINLQAFGVFLNIDEIKR